MWWGLFVKEPQAKKNLFRDSVSLCLSRKKLDLNNNNDSAAGHSLFIKAFTRRRRFRSE